MAQEAIIILIHTIFTINVKYNMMKSINFLKSKIILYLIFLSYLILKFDLSPLSIFSFFTIHIFNDAKQTAIFFHHLLMMTVALLSISSLDFFTHHDIDSQRFFLVKT